MIFDIRVKNVISENNSYKQNDTLHIQDIETRSREQKDRIIVIPSNSSTPSNVYNNNKREKSIHPFKLLKYMEWKNFIPPDRERERERERISGASKSCHSSFCSASYISWLRVFHRITRADVEISIHEQGPLPLPSPPFET